MRRLDYSPLPGADAERVKQALSKGEELLTGYIPDHALGFLLRNYKGLAERGILERNWMQAYLHASHFNDVPLSQLREIFDICDRKILQKHYPIPPLHRLSGERYSLFRGCAGPDHRMGMSWVTSLDKAIYYAARHAALRQLENLAVYATTVGPREIYCCGAHYDFDYIVCPVTWWRVDVPVSEFRIDRPR